MALRPPEISTAFNLLNPPRLRNPMPSAQFCPQAKRTASPSIWWRRDRKSAFLREMWLTRAFKALFVAERRFRDEASRQMPDEDSRQMP